MNNVKTGDRVRFTGKFLKSTGQQLGQSGMSRWVVQACSCSLCASGRVIATDEPLDTSTGYEDQTAEWRANAKRHIAMANLQKI